MPFMPKLIDALNSVSDYFYSLYLDVYGWVYPFSLSADLFYRLCLLFNTLARHFYDFSLWVTDVQSKVTSILSWNTIWSYILTNIPNLTQLRDWFYNWAANITNTVNTWWSATQSTVLAWVQDAKNLSTTLFNQTNTWLTSLQASWDNFKGRIAPIDLVLYWWGNWWGNVLAQLTPWWNSQLLDVQSLLNSAFTTRESLWSGWQDMRAQVVNFFTDPVEFIWQRFTNWFLGPEG